MTVILHRKNHWFHCLHPLSSQSPSPNSYFWCKKKTRQLSSIDPASGPDACKPVVVDFSDGQDSARAHWLCCSLIILLWTTILFPCFQHITFKTWRFTCNYITWKSLLYSDKKNVFTSPVTAFCFQSESGKLEEISLTRNKLNKTLLS